jgi:hypothetical protein
LKTVFAADGHLAEGQLLHEEPTVNKGNSLKSRIGKRMATLLSKKGRNLKPLYTATRKRASKWRLQLLKEWKLRRFKGLT